MNNQAIQSNQIIEYRSAEIKSTPVEGNTDEFELSFSSDKPYERFWGIEILDHSKNSIRMDRLNDGAAVLIDHQSDQVGVVTKSWIDDKEKKLKGLIKFSKSYRGTEVKQDVIDGIRKNVSIGYVIHDMILEEKKENVPIFRVNDWEPLEVSIVSVPADPSVGFGRSEQNSKALRNKIESITNTQKARAIEMSEEKTQEKTLNKEELLKQERERIVEIESLGKRHNMDLSAHVKNGSTIEEVRGFVLENLPPSKPLVKPTDVLDLSHKEIKKYSLMKAINYVLNRDSRHAEYEIECSDEIAKKIGDRKRATSLFIPMDIFKRDLTAGTATAAAELVGTDHLASEFIELLRNKSLVFQSGARVLSGLQGNVSIPRLDAAATGAWVSTEGAGASESQQTTGSLTLSPKEASANVDMTRQLILQSDPSVEGLVRDDLSIVLALLIDKAVYSGSGASGQPTGLDNTSGVGSVTISSMTFAKAVEFESDIDTANALEGNLSFHTTPAVRGTLKTRAKESGYPVYICSENNMVNGYPMYTTGQVAANYIYFGNWRQVLIGEWGGLEIDVYKTPRTGVRTITAFKTVDVGIRQPGAFSAGSSFS